MLLYYTVLQLYDIKQYDIVYYNMAIYCTMVCHAIIILCIYIYIYMYMHTYISYMLHTLTSYHAVLYSTSATAPSRWPCETAFHEYLEEACSVLAGVS